MGKDAILYVGGDLDDKFLVSTALSDIGCESKVVNFDNGYQLLEYLRNTEERPFFILCDLNIPQITGLELKEKINADDELKKRSIPFIFLSDSVNPRDVDEAYLSLVQGFYLKPPTYDALKEQLSYICGYWERAILPGRNNWD
ncbi:response regulator [Dyadobacter sp. CY345]|uniref:response regulator n=1 Tax=Dyadobacter sp. CY345 TaxID=2909335 RepID=UPI001F1AFA4E|nr:response regulator [Dyadobacter sp. CY345]MCF2443610.1 response regulator [Dyadobacter sp. CY345]